MEKGIEGARRIGATWYYWKRTPDRLVKAFGLPEFRRESMRTKDPDEAARLARAYLTELDELARKLDSISSRVRHFDQLSEAAKDKLDADIEARIAKLPVDQRKLLGAEGGIWGAGKAMRRFEGASAFLQAGLGAEYSLKDVIGETYDPEEREEEEARDQASIDRAKKKVTSYRSALTAAGVIESAANAATGLRSLLEKYCEAKGYIHTSTVKNKTRGQFEYSVRRFIEYHGDLPLADLKVGHLSCFAADFLKLPVSSRKDIRPLAFHDAVRAGEREGLPRTSERTRDQNLTHLKALMAYAVKEGDRDAPDPWAGYTVTEKKGKVSAGRVKKRYVFSRDEIKAIVSNTGKIRDPNTVDYWGPLFGAFHGLRLEEVSQLRVADITTEEGILCVSVTDEGELQKVKNTNTFRTIPVHEGLVDRGFADFVLRRRQAGGDMLFMEAKRWGGKLSEIAFDGQGRYGTFYGSRFGRVLEKMEIVGYKAGFHSFRHAWTDLARNAGIDPEQRRALAGRDSTTDEYRVDNTEDRYGHGFSVRVLAKSLNSLKPLD